MDLDVFKPSTQAQWGKGAGVGTKTVGVDPRKKEAIEEKANNDNTPDRTSLGKRTYLVDGNSGEGQFKEQETGRVVASFERSEGFHEEPKQEPAKDVADAKFKAAELQQVEATAVTVSIPRHRRGLYIVSRSKSEFQLIVSLVLLLLLANVFLDSRFVSA